jgi:predicted amidohydrolase
MHIHLIQTDIIWERPTENRDSLEKMFGGLNPIAGDIIVLPEMYATGFSMNTALSEEKKQTDAPNTSYLIRKSKEFQCCVIGGIAIQSKNLFHNESVAAFPNGELVRYQKNNLFPLANENQTYTAGKELTTFEWNSWIIGMSICYDLRFPELYRGLTAKGANLMITIANWPVDRIDHWVTLLKARAIENQSYIVGVNRTGADPNSNYNGRSMAIDPMGSIILDAGEQHGVFSTTIEIGKVSSWRNNFPALKSIQNSSYI